MRGLQRLRGSASALSTCSATSVRTAQAASLLKTELPTQHNRPRISMRRTQNWSSGPQIQRRCLSASVIRKDKDTILPVAEDIILEDLIPQDEAPRQTRRKGLVVPGRTKVATRQEDVMDPDYVPAEEASGLEEVGGLEDWWEKPDHWGPDRQYHGFGPSEKVMDRAVLEVLTKRAVIEAIVLRRFSGNKIEPPTALTLTHGEEELLGVVGTEVVASENGTVALKNEHDYQRIWDNLTRPQPEAEEISVSAAPLISTEAARELISSWDPSWKTLRLRDPVLKFYIAKRIQRLTGHRICDGKFMGIETARSLVNYLAEPPKAKKLADELENMGVLSDLPNVKVIPRRVTPVDKDKEIGRWKVIQKELQKRGLPVFGNAGYRKAVEKTWISGGV